MDHHPRSARAPGCLCVDGQSPICPARHDDAWPLPDLTADDIARRIGARPGDRFMAHPAGMAHREVSIGQR